ncbi:integrator complex subunit 12-like [Dendronephthya gigantea]|uniref:integrator complex subunit 12-like n=1 Tax=Dendronephthya gigantea TaxID=151771 RepID=UPI00106A6685|nr:integrator complex subunit 12-like [Dendronephthya gigantea]
MASEIDPILVRALNLLHSKNPRALEQLCALRDEVLGKKPDYVPEKKKDEVKEPVQVETIKKPLSKPPPLKADPITISSDSSGPATIEEVPETSLQILGKVKTEDVTETVEVESLSFGAGTNDHPDDDIMETVEELGLSYVEETLEESNSSNLLVKRKRPKLEISTGKSLLDDLDVESHESSPDHEMSPDLSVSKCIICSSGKSGIPGNQLVECHECHELYHQNCHKPRITDQSIDDLRHVWYCRNCSKQMKQASTATAVPKLKPIPSPGILSNKPQTQSFKAPLRVEQNKPPLFSPSSPSVNQSFIIPNLATSTAVSGSGVIKSPSHANPREMARNSMKRLQQVKKKAAAKNQQKFTKR